MPRSRGADHLLSHRDGNQRARMQELLARASLDRTAGQGLRRRMEGRAGVLPGSSVDPMLPAAWLLDVRSVHLPVPVVSGGDDDLQSGAAGPWGLQAAVAAQGRNPYGA